MGAVFLVGGGLALTRFTRNLSTGGADPVMNGDEFALLEKVSDIMIPATDTPGAVDARVPEFVRDMLEQWASLETRGEIVSVLRAIEKCAWSRFGSAFL